MSRYNPPRSEPLPGYVYVLTCPSFPGCCKIGGTGRTATHRAGELVREYVSGEPFVVVYQSKPVSDWPAAELAAHRMLSDCRVTRSELFRCTPKRARAVIRAVARAHGHPWLAWLLPGPRRSPGPPWRRNRGVGAVDLVGLVPVLSVAGLVVWLKPVAPSWLPASMAHVLAWLETL